MAFGPLAYGAVPSRSEPGDLAAVTVRSAAAFLASWLEDDDENLEPMRRALEARDVAIRAEERFRIAAMWRGDIERLKRVGGESPAYIEFLEDAAESLENEERK